MGWECSGWPDPAAAPSTASVYNWTDGLLTSRAFGINFIITPEALADVEPTVGPHDAVRAAAEVRSRREQPWTIDPVLTELWLATFVYPCAPATAAPAS